ncbi:MAG: NAD(P)H-dependent oxidoreductase subunit E [Planctomycetes bacterium]|nr:NAD(P)H-dependent oxidoreductase subunit E [Planctomycetota bacterium]
MNAPASLPIDPAPAAPRADLAPIETIVGKLGRTREQLIPILQAIQAHYRYLPKEALERVCALTEITPAQLVSVATFYKQFRHTPCGKHLIRVCHGTACHVSGAGAISEAFEKHLHLPPGQSTDAEGAFTLEKVACLGCCSLAPAVQIDDGVYGNLTPGAVPYVLEEVRRAEKQGSTNGDRPSRNGDGAFGEIRIALDSCCLARGADKVFASLQHVAERFRLPARVKPVGCTGLSCHAPLIEIVRPGLPRILYADIKPEDAEAIALRHFEPRSWCNRLRSAATRALDALVDDTLPARNALPAEAAPVREFLGRQLRLATEHSGEMNPLDLAEYQARGGFQALERAMKERTPDELIAEITKSGLRGRGGAGYSTGTKWRQVRDASGLTKYVICNGDEGDPGAFMDRMILESYPFRVIEGLAASAWAVGAREGIFYIREEYPLAVQRIEQAIARCEDAGILGRTESDSAPCFRVVRGAGAFVCGEETALIASLKGERGRPRLRPPYPSECGFRGCPTLVNNVETLALVSWILRNGAESFTKLGTPRSAGTKVFALAGKVRRSGLVEVPMGITLREIVEKLGGGVPNGKRLKAVQIGGPSGGCVPASLADTPIDYEALVDAGAIMGSGGMVVLDEDDCMVDIARYFLRFANDECCGRCSFGRIGSRRLLDILERICTGQGRPGDLDDMQRLGRAMKVACLCGLGKTAPNPVLSTLRHFREEYEAHLAGRCPAGRCKELIRYEIGESCIGCTLCAQHCPADCIPMAPYQVHTIDSAKCTRCDACRQVCPVDAVKVR